MMNNVTLDQSKTETNKKEVKETRLTLDQFKQFSTANNNEELEKLTGGVMASCHSTSNPLYDYWQKLWGQTSGH